MDRLWRFKKEEQNSLLRSEISVFLALVFVLTASLVLYTVEMLRTQAAQTYLQTAANSAIDSLFSQYHRQLWDEYRLLGIEMYSEEEITDEYYGFFAPYLDQTDNFNWYSLTAQQDSAGIDNYSLMTDESGHVFEEEVKEYIVYGLALDLAGLEEGQAALTEVESAVSTGETADEMEDCSEAAEELQDELNELGEKVSEHNAAVTEMHKKLQACDGSGIKDSIEDLRDLLSDITDEIEDVENKTAGLKSDVSRTRTELDGKLAAGKVSSENYDQLVKRLDDFDSYTEERGEKNRELRKLAETAQKNLSLLDDVEEEAEAAVEYINNWEPQQILTGYGPPEKEGGEPVPIYEDEVLDETEVWKPVAESFESYEKLDYTSETIAVDEEKSGLFDGVRDLLGKEVLELVIPNASTLSTVKRDFSEAPSKIHSDWDPGSFFSIEGWINKAAVEEYAMLELSNLLSGEKKNSSVNSENHAVEKQTAAGQKEALKKEIEFTSAEVEYVLCGKETDRENAAAVAAELVAVRTGLNLAHMFTDPLKLKEASALAASLSGVAAGTPLVLVMTFLVLNVWAGAQAVLDVRQLFQGGKVPLIHTRETFTLTLENLLGHFQETLEKTEQCETGLDYEAYLRMLLVTRSRVQTDYRIMDVIQWNLREKQQDFRMDRLYASLKISVYAESKHIFSGLFGGDRSRYGISVKTYYEY